MALLITVVFILVWYLPLFLKHRKTEREHVGYYLRAFFFGCIAFILALIAQTQIDNLIDTAQLNGVRTEIAEILYALIGIVLVEEVLKFFAGYTVLRNKTELSEAGAMLIMGAAGAGFELLESALNIDAIASVFRGVLSFHIFWQLFMGKYWYKAQKAKLSGDSVMYKKNLRLAFAAPVITHFLFDYPIFKLQEIYAQDETAVSEALQIVLLCIPLIVGIVCVIYAMRMAYGTLKEKQV